MSFLLWSIFPEISPFGALPRKNSEESNFCRRPSSGQTMEFCPSTVFPNGGATWDKNLIRALRASRPHSVQPGKSGFPVFVKKLP
jgi:hypothetical protein